MSEIFFSSVKLNCTFTSCELNGGGGGRGGKRTYKKYIEKKPTQTLFTSNMKVKKFQTVNSFLYMHGENL